MAYTRFGLWDFALRTRPTNGLCNIRVYAQHARTSEIAVMAALIRLRNELTHIVFNSDVKDYGDLVRTMSGFLCAHSSRPRYRPPYPHISAI